MGYNPEAMFGLKTAREAQSRTTTWVDEDGKRQSHTVPKPKRTKRTPAAAKVAVGAGVHMWGFRTEWDANDNEFQVETTKTCANMAEAIELQSSMAEDGWHMHIDCRQSPKSFKHLLVPAR